MEKTENKKKSMIWLIVLILLILVVVTLAILLSIWRGYMMDDSGAIPIVPDSTQTSQNINTEEENKVHYSMQISDGETVWTMDTAVELFAVEYENGQKEVTVKSSNGDKVIAPGTTSSYTFKMKNTGNAALDYVLDVDAFFEPIESDFPMTGRISRYDGKWILGDEDEYGKLSGEASAQDAYTLSPGRYVYYTLEWEWPYESGKDEWDTMLGNEYSTQNIAYMLQLSVTAEQSEDPDVQSGIIPPQTGDNSMTVLWLALAVCSFGMLLFLVITGRRSEKEEEAEAEKLGKV